MNKVFANNHLDIPRPTVSFTSSIPPFKNNVPTICHEAHRWGPNQTSLVEGPICAPCSNTWILWMTVS